MITFFASFLGEFGQFPFASNLSISLADLFLSITIIFFLFMILKRRKYYEELPRSFILVIAFWVVGVFSLIFSLNLGGGLYLLRFISYSFAFFIGYQLVKTKTIDIIRIFYLVILTGFIFTLGGFLQLIFYPDFKYLEYLGYDPHKNRLASTFLDPNFAGIYIAISLFLTFFLFKLKKKIIYLFLIIFFSVGIFLTFSRSAYLMTFLGLAIYSFFKEKVIFFFLILVLLIGALLIPRVLDRLQGAINLDETAKKRIQSWENGVFIFNNNPYLGVGFNNLRFNLEKYNLFDKYLEDGGNSGAGIDSSFIFVLATTGILGFFIYLGFWISIIFVLIREKSEYLIFLFLVLGLLISSQFINSLFYPPIMLTLYVLLGSILAKDD
ncbi:O-antigen ligase family protein [Candidatus Daviesbacteria bacterium]|nr:O-antigen ligase family protein [Candidatus Daviesbacteria bacterium]